MALCAVKAKVQCASCAEAEESMEMHGTTSVWDSTWLPWAAHAFCVATLRSCGRMLTHPLRDP